MNTNRIKTLCAVFAVVLTGVFVAKGDRIFLYTDGVTEAIGGLERS